MELILYKNFSKRKNSTKQPGTVTRSLTVQTKQPTNLESPTFVITAPVDLDVNYCKFAGHYYFVDDIVLSVNGYYELRCSQDVLATHKAEINAYNGFVHYGIFRNPLARDNSIPANVINQKEQIKGVQTKTTNIVSTIEPVKTATQTAVDNVNKWAVVFRTASTAGSTYSENTDGLADHVGFMKSFKRAIAGVTGVLGSVFTNVFVRPTDYIFNAIAYPFVPDSLYDSSSSSHQLKVGIWDLPDDQFGYHTPDFIRTFTVSLSRPDRIYNDFRDYSAAYTTCNLRVLNQTVSMDPVWLQYSLKCELKLDILTGSAKATIYAEFSSNDGAKYNILTVNGNGACSIQVVKTDYSNKVNGFISGVASTAANAATGNAVGAAASIAGIGMEAAQNVSQSVNGTLDSYQDAYEAWKVTISVCRSESCNVPFGVTGFPINAVTDPTTLSYAQYLNPSIEMSGLGNDRDTVNAYLASGIYLD